LSQMDFNNWSKCLNGTSTAWASLLLQVLGSEVRQSFSEKNDTLDAHIKKDVYTQTRG